MCPTLTTPPGQEGLGWGPALLHWGSLWGWLQRKSCLLSDPCRGGFSTWDWCLNSFPGTAGPRGCKSCGQHLSRPSVAEDLQDLLPEEQQRLDDVQESTCPGASVLWGIIFHQHLSGFFQPISHSPCCSFLYYGTPCAAGRTLGGMLEGWWGIGGSSALRRSFQSLRPLGLLDGVGGWVSLPLVSPV